MMMTAAIILMVAICLGSTTLANTATTLVMPHVVTQNGPCDIPDPCPDPATNTTVGATIAAYLLVRNCQEIGGV